MKNFQKFILPLLIIVFVILVYIIYFSPKEGLGSFSDFDPNNTANKDIRVELVKEKGIRKDQQSGSSIFYARDRNGTEIMVQAPLMLPPTIESSSVIVLRGHLHKEYFHAADVMAD